MNRLLLFTASLISVSILFYLLIIGENLIIPFVISLVIWYLINSVRQLFMKIRIGNRNLPGWLTLTAATASIIIILTLVGTHRNYSCGCRAASCTD